MKTRTIIIVAAIALISLLFYFSKSGFLHKGGMSPVRASTASAQEKPGAMQGMPGMAAEAAAKAAACRGGRARDAARGDTG